jgi:Predicted metal-dependent hydrolase
VRNSLITFGSHTGTHVDAPSHFLKDGKCIDQISLDRLMGPAKVIDMVRVIDVITAEDLKHHDINEQDIILLRTMNSAYEETDEFNKEFVYLDQSAAAYLAERKIKAVGIDYLGIERGNPEHATHTKLMHADIVIIEGLRLSHVQAGDYFMVCLPLLVVGLDAAPARVILMTE